MCPKADISLSPTPLTPPASSQPLSNADNRTPLRAKTLGTRLTLEELAEVEAAAKQSGKNVAEWLREVALRAARPSPDVNELLLGEIAATRYLVLNLFDASAKAALKNETLPPGDVLKIRDAADSRKGTTARKLLQEFMAPSAKNGGAR